MFILIFSCGKVTEVSELIYDFALQLPKRYIHSSVYRHGWKDIELAGKRVEWA